MDDRAKQLAALLIETYRHCGGSGERAGIFAAVAAVLAPIAADVAALKAVRKPAVEHPWSQEIEDYYRDDAPPSLVPQPPLAPLCHVCGQGVANPIATTKGPAHLSCAAEGTPPERPGPTRGAEDGRPCEDCKGSGIDCISRARPCRLCNGSKRAPLTESQMKQMTLGQFFDGGWLLRRKYELAVKDLIDAERAAARAEAIDAAERAVREFPSAALHRGVFNEVAAAMARLRDVP